jgi:N-acetylmuramoyl-L-alanine amidase
MRISTRPVLLCALLAAAPLAASVEPEPAAEEPEAMEEVVLDMTDPQDCLALAMYWESKGEGEEGMLAVGSVVLNRATSPDFPDDVCAVVTDGGETPPCQFSFWCDGESDQPVEAEPWALARDLALRLTTEPPPDPTGGALYFHGAGVEPDWAPEKEETARIGDHFYYR